MIEVDFEALLNTPVEKLMEAGIREVQTSVAPREAQTKSLDRLILLENHKNYIWIVFKRNKVIEVLVFRDARVNHCFFTEDRESNIIWNSKDTKCPQRGHEKLTLMEILRQRRRQEQCCPSTKFPTPHD